MAEIVLTALIIALIIWWLVEYRFHRRNLSRIPIRIHINGSRGKSSITRLIGAALREGGIRTVTKTTGTDACLIFPDGSEKQIVRLGPANIKEQRWVVRQAAKLNPQALVIECMAIDPELQWVLQNKYIEGTVGVITNVRADHLDVMGPTVQDAAKAMAAVMPDGRKNPNAICFTAESELFPLLEEIADKVKCKLISSDPDSISNEEIENFSYIEHKENVALVLAIAKHFGIDRETALRGMWSANPDPGVLRIHSVEYNGKKIRFANAFAANDPDSTIIVYEMLREKMLDDEKFIVIGNSRADRIQRARQLGERMSKMPAEKYILVGALLKAIAENMQKIGIRQDRIRFISDGSPGKIADEICATGDEKYFAIGIGNIGGPGHDIADFFENLEREQSKKFS